MIGKSEMVRVVDLSKHYPVRKGLFGRRVSLVKALQSVSLSIREGESVALVGESGSGKSTLGRLLLRLERPTEGEIWFEGKNIAAKKEKELFDERRRMQIIFQDPYGSLNPRLTAGEAIAEVLRVHKLAPREQAAERAVEMLEKVELSAADFGKYPHEFSGGQRQRIGIARAIATRPRFLVADEPVSALDVSIQAHILQLLERLKSELNLTILFISHNLAIVEQIADRVAVLYRGLLQEEGPTGELFRNPLHPYTKMLIESVPRLGSQRRLQSPTGVMESRFSAEDARGCPFHLRCPAATDPCSEIRPDLTDFGGGRRVACLNLPTPSADP